MFFLSWSKNSWISIHKKSLSQQYEYTNRLKWNIIFLTMYFFFFLVGYISNYSPYLFFFSLLIAKRKFLNPENYAYIYVRGKICELVGCDTGRLQKCGEQVIPGMSLPSRERNPSLGLSSLFEPRTVWCRRYTSEQWASRRCGRPQLCLNRFPRTRAVSFRTRARWYRPLTGATGT